MLLDWEGKDLGSNVCHDRGLRCRAKISRTRDVESCHKGLRIAQLQTWMGNSLEMVGNSLSLRIKGDERDPNCPNSLLAGLCG